MSSNFGDQYVELYTFVAGGAIGRGHAVKLHTTENQVVQCDSQGEIAYGIALNEALAGEQVTVLRRGRHSKAISGAALTLNAQLTPGADGQYEVAATGDVVVGYAREAVGAADLEFCVELDTAHRVVP